MAFAAMVLLGAAGAAFTIGAQTRLQMAVEDGMTSRVMALYSVSFTGSKPIGGMIAGLVMDLSNSRVALGVGASAIATSTGAYVIDTRKRAKREEALIALESQPARPEKT